MKKPKSPSKKDRRHMVADTNILWHETKDVPVSPEFDTFIAEHCGDHNVGLAIPETVLGELLYQHTSTGLELLLKIEKNLSVLSAVADSEYKLRTTPDRVKTDVRKKLTGWFTTKGAEILPTPVQSIDWERLASDAIWRIPPFTEDRKNKSEKGFRDALILETTIAHADANKNVQVDFVSNDRALRDAVKLRAKGKRVAVFESLSDYGSHLRLLDQRLTEEFVSAISDRASEKFFSKLGKPCLWRDEEISQKARSQFPDKFAAPAEPTSSSRLAASFPGLFTTDPEWRKLSDESVWIFRPAFQSREGRNIYTWASRFQYVQFFKNHGASTGSILGERVEAGEVRIRKIVFEATWKVTVGTDGRFRTPEISSIEYVETVFRPPTESEYSRYAPELQEN